MNLSTKELVDRAKNFLFQRQRAYRTTFMNPVGETVLADLVKFCRACETTFDKDPTVSDHLDGRREVWLRIQHHLRLSEAEIWKMYSGEK